MGQWWLHGNNETSRKLQYTFQDKRYRNINECLLHHHSIYLRLKHGIKNNNLSFEEESVFWDATNWINIFKYGLFIFFIRAIYLIYIIVFCNPLKSIFSNCTHKPSLSHTDIELTTPFNPRHNKRTPTLTRHHWLNQRSLMKPWLHFSSTICTHYRLANKQETKTKTWKKLKN
jgi:hypothetical protein